MSGRKTWLGLLALCAAVEAYGIRRPDCGWTLSELTRSTFRTDTRTGRLAFCLAWSALTGWFLPHILRGTHGVGGKRPARKTPG